MTITAILTADEMRAAERALFDAGTPEYELMERAGRAAADHVWRTGGTRDTLVLCGPGNNGGDGFVVARLLREHGVPVRVAAMGESRTDSSRRARAAWNGPVEDIFTAAPATQLVDALFGTGLARPLGDALARRLGELAQAASKSHTIDLPSGMHSDSGECLSPVPRFGLCIALGAYKPSHFLQPSAGCFARLVCADIGIPLDGARTRHLAPPRLHRPSVDAHKYSRGLVAVIGGEMAGAAALAANGCAHAGAGYVRLYQEGHARGLPHAIVVQTVRGRDELAARLADGRIGALLVGPGLGRNAEAAARLRIGLEGGHPTVVDADGLWLLKDGGLGLLPEKAILTPHEGEFAHLFGALAGSKLDRARAAARMAKAVIVCKGADTVIAAPDGRAAIGGPFSSWLSTAGTGDVLAGICAARLAVTGDPFLAACEAVWLHGDAARRAGAAFIADDLIARLPAAIAARL